MTDRSFCVGCDRLDMCALEPLSRHCALKFKMKAQQPQTNGDNLRTLSDEKLAETFAWHMVELVCRVASNFNCDLGPEKQFLFEQNKVDWLDWLQSPVDGDNDDGT